MHSIIHSFPYRVRYADTDKMQYMYNGHYLRLFEIGRTELLRSVGLPYVELESAGFLMPVLESRVFYKLPALYDDMLTIECTFTPERTPTIKLHYRILRAGERAVNGHVKDDELVADGYTVHCFVDAQSRKPVRPPAMFSDAVKKKLFN